MRVSPALAADLVAAAFALVGAFASHGSVRAWSLAAGFGLLFVAFVRFGARRAVGFVVDEAEKTLQIGNRRVQLSEVCVGPRRPDGRSFRLYVLQDRVRTYEVHGDAVVGAAALHTTLERLGRKVTVAHPERHDLAATVRRVLPIALGLFGFTFVGRAMSAWGSDPLPLVLFGGIALTFALADAAGVAGPPFIVDAAQRRVYWRRWYPLAEVHLMPPRVSNLTAPDLALDVGGWHVRLGPAWTAVAPVKAELARLGVAHRTDR